MTTGGQAPKLKHVLDAHLVRALAADLVRADASFDADAFVERGTHGLDDLELTPRAWHLADALHAHLPRPFARAAAVLVASLGPAAKPDGELGLSTLRYLPHVYFVQRYGLGDFEAAMHAQYELTRRFTAEFSIRAFLVRYPDATYARLVEWTRDPDVHVRRLVSEGTRPRLPWAPRLRAFQDDPAPVLALLERLKDDPERYVQRSVANNLNDIAKDHPDVIVEVCQRWSRHAPAGRQWIVGHALRSLIKRGHPGALAILGAGDPPEVTVTRVRLAPSPVRLGGELRFALVLSSAAARRQDLVVDYAVHFVKASGALRPKVFKLKRLTLDPGASVALAGKVSFAAMTTRQHYPGRHRLELLVNGVPLPLGELEVRS